MATLVPSLDSTQMVDAEIARLVRPVSSEESRPRPYFVFRVADTWLGVPASCVACVLDDQGYSPIPSTPPHVLGVISWRDRVIALLDLASFCALPAGAQGGRFLRTVVLEDGPLSAGLRVDVAAGVVELADPELVAASAIQGERLLPFLVAEAQTPWGYAGILEVRAILEAARVRD